jgi:surface polysaccharide O-acyltransferase-like enzyme
MTLSEKLTEPVAATASPERAARSDHYANLDRLRIVAIIDIVLYHVDMAARWPLPGIFSHRPLLGMGLPVFLLTSIMLTCRRAAPPPLGNYVGRRIGPLLLPWVVWSAIYLVVEAGFLIPRVGVVEWRKSLSWMMPLYGTMYHLWFLPFILAAGAMALMLHRATLQWPAATVVCTGLLLGVALTSIPPGDWDEYPLQTWWFSLPCIPLGWAMGRLIGSQSCHGRAGVLMGLAITAAALIYITTQGLALGVGRYLLAIGLIVLCVAAPGRPDAWTTRLVKLVMGVYLLHVLPILLLHFAYEPAKAPYWLAAACALPLCAAVVAVLQLTPLRKIV